MWIKTSRERPHLPMPGERVIACTSGFCGEAYVDREGCWYRMYGISWERAFGSENPVEKWMPMPEGD